MKCLIFLLFMPFLWSQPKGGLQPGTANNDGLLWDGTQWVNISKSAMQDTLYGIISLDSFTGANDSIKLATALSVLGSEANLYFKPDSYSLGTQTIDLNVIIPRGVILNGTLSFTGNFDAGDYKIFHSSSTIDFSGSYIQDIYPGWWGFGDGYQTDATYINKAIQSVATRSATIKLRNAVYRCTEPIDLRGTVAGDYNRINLEGSFSHGSYNLYETTRIFFYNTDIGIKVGAVDKNTYGGAFKIQNLMIDMNNANDSAVAIDGTYGFSYSSFKNIWINSDEPNQSVTGIYFVQYFLLIYYYRDVN